MHVSPKTPSDPSTRIGQPGAWKPAQLLVRRLVRPVERFLAIQAASGIVLLFTAVLALAWANSRWSASYAALWHTPLGVHVAGLRFERDLHFWINDGLMTIFFFVVGLEIRREIHQGELSDLRRAALPLVAAVGGMLVPAAIFLVLNHGQPSARGWGIPMATDIAFAVGVLALLGPRVPPALRVLLLALAVIDDVGAILVIALFYSSGIEPVGFAVASVGIAAIVVMQGFGVRAPLAYVLPALVVWAGAYHAGIHPTLAGVAVGLLTPVRAWVGESASPVDHLQRQFHATVAFGIMPLFALANAGVPLAGVSISGPGALVFAGIAAGLVAGKTVGITGASWLAVRAGFAAVPRGVRWSGVLVVGLVGGIGFTMSLFVAGLAYPPGPMLETAKLAVLAGSTTAAVGGLLLGRAVLPREVDRGAAPTAYDAETSTES
ncbi:MAG: Na+/H+ antiporter NhaA [Myxococcales bacterium]|nr:Na+/H+ antiporter NhaA [Myxococcales bacterium]